jgi:DNA-binding IclR family transcriptional regulator
VPAGSAPRSAADRLLDVLAAFDQRNSSLSLTDISHRAGLPLTTAHRLVGALTRWGALERDESGDYHIGLRLWEIASLAPRGVGIREAAMPFLEDLYELTHENVHFAVRDGVEVVYIERISGRTAVRVRSNVGARWPLHATGVGLVLLAHADATLQERIYDWPMRAFTPYTVTDPALLRRMLAQIRQTGFAVSDRQITTDALSVAAPVRDQRGDVVAAVSVVVHAENGDPKALAPVVRVAARGISLALGWKPDPGTVSASAPAPG